MPRGSKKGPQIRRGIADFDDAYSFEWPVYPVKLSSDPDEIRQARLRPWHYSGDPATQTLGRAWQEEFEHPVEWVPHEPRELMDGAYVIPTSTTPLRTYSPLVERPRPVDAFRGLKPQDAEAVLQFISRYGFLGSTVAAGEPSALYGESIERVRRDYQELTDVMAELDSFRTGEEPDVWQSNLAIPRLNGALMEGVGPVLRVRSEGGKTRFDSGFTVRFLIDAIRLQAYLDLTEGVVTNRCPGCGIFFGKRHGSQRFCSPTCSNSHRQREHRKRKAKGE